LRFTFLGILSNSYHYIDVLEKVINDKNMKYLALLSMFFFLVSCGGSKENLPETYEDNGVGAKGYDLVSYFTDSTATEGSNQFRCQYKDIVYHFSSQENKDTFVANPDKYLPAYGGWCAYAVAEHQKKMAPDPTSWDIQDGKLIFFYDDFFTKLQGGLKKKWDTDPTDHKAKADKNWSIMSKE